MTRNISVAVGASYSVAQQSNKVPVAVFGDGATDCGTFWESLNLAGLHKLPILFLCLDNELAVHSGEGYVRVSNGNSFELLLNFG